MKTSASSIALAAVLVAAMPARAHVVLDQTSAPAGSSYRAVFRVGHGCNGLPTRGITVRIPAGVRSAHPMPKPGWVLQVRADAAEIRWTAERGVELPDAWYDEFVLRATLPFEPGVLWFQVVQTCDDHGREVRKEWVQSPKEGTSIEGLTEPAAMLRVEPAPPAMPAGHVH